MPEASPLIVTLALDQESAQFFNALRQRYFPPDRNFLDAHLTLFHHLPSNEPKIKEDLVSWSKEREALPLQITEVKSIGKGVAYKIEAAPLLQLHRIMQKAWEPWLKSQDKQKLWPHVTVQNKVTPAIAKETWATLQTTFKPFTVTGTGFQLWSYEGGPWRFIEAFSFNGKL
ncbi:MAG TPA: 2'-5' RNA ligase family protein [Flavisolibacter sp.]|nr:2'-5' RNA ligase family protein [Flavisolibacter sp.]